MATNPKKKPKIMLPEPEKPPILPQAAREEYDLNHYVLRIDPERSGLGPVFSMRREVTFRSQDVWVRFKEYYPGMDYCAYRINIVANSQLYHTEKIAYYKSEFSRFVDEALEKIGDLYETFFSLKRDDREKRTKVLSTLSAPGMQPIAVYTLSPHSMRIFQFFVMADETITMAHYRWLSGLIDSDQLSQINRQITKSFRVLAQRLTFVTRKCFERIDRITSGPPKASVKRQAPAKAPPTATNLEAAATLPASTPKPRRKSKASSSPAAAPADAPTDTTAAPAAGPEALAAE